MASVMIDCPPAKIAFREAIGYQRLGDLLKALGNPSEELLGSLLDMVSLQDVATLGGNGWVQPALSLTDQHSRG